MWKTSLITHLWKALNRSFVCNAGYLAFVLFLGTGAAPARESIKPGWNLFSRQQDIQLGREAAREIEKKVEIVHDQELSNYVVGIGKRLAANSQAPEYPYTFKVVADPSINAFALPGGPIFVHTGTLTAADSEAQFAGVVAHEIAHVALRHSTHQMSKARAWQIPLAIATGTLDRKGGLLAGLGKMGIHFGADSLFLKYSRDAEKDADIVGARMMAKSRYDPIEMARFFMKLEEKSKGGGLQFFPDHPNPGNRVKYVEEEVSQLSWIDYVEGFPKFDEMRARAARVKPSGGKSQAGGGSEPDQVPVPGKLRNYSGKHYRLSYPERWQVFAANDGRAVTIVPEGGVVPHKGSRTIVRGLMAGYFEGKHRALRTGTNQVIGDLKAAKAGLYPVPGRRCGVTLGAQRAEFVLLQGPGVLPGQHEFVYLVTSARPEGLFYLVLILPQGDYEELRSQHHQILNSVRFH